MADDELELDDLEQQGLTVFPAGSPVPPERQVAFASALETMPEENRARAVRMIEDAFGGRVIPTPVELASLKDLAEIANPVDGFEPPPLEAILLHPGPSPF